MKVLVTGGLGFIGSHTVVELLNKGHNVVIVDNLVNSKEYVLNRIEDISGVRPIFYNTDITDSIALEEVFREEKIECVVHFAALKSNADSIVDPALYYYNNIHSSYVLLELMKKYSVKKLVFSSSATVYGNNKNVPIKETEIIGEVISPYGLTKYLNELFFRDKSESTKSFKCISLRYFNPIGAHQSGLLGEDAPFDIPNNLILYLLKVAKKEIPYLNVYSGYNTTDGSGIRDYIHVVDLAKGHIAAIDYLDKMDSCYDVFNLGTGQGHSVIEFIKLFEKVNNVKIPFKIVGKRPGDVDVSFADVNKAKILMGWEAKFTLKDCLRDVWNFARNN